jgi:photosystem II stability/assembly factor-like uncharacterized protein
MSSDGKRLAAAVYGGFIYTSFDCGESWIERSSAGSRFWMYIAMSSNGMTLGAVVGGQDYPEMGYIYTSPDGGATWIARISAGLRNWQVLAISADGMSLVAGEDVEYDNGTAAKGYIYTSYDGGENWTERNASGNHDWVSIAISSDGKRIAATSSDALSTSSDGGISWTLSSDPVTEDWRAIASSEDGMMLAGGGEDEYIYTSTDGGLSWTVREASGLRWWSSIAMSSDGKKLVASVGFEANNFESRSGYVYFSPDGGSTWNALTTLGSNYWASVAISADGSDIAAASASLSNDIADKNGGYIHSYRRCCVCSETAAAAGSASEGVDLSASQS